MRRGTGCGCWRTCASCSCAAGTCRRPWSRASETDPRRRDDAAWAHAAGAAPVAPGLATFTFRRLSCPAPVNGVDPAPDGTHGASREGRDRRCRRPAPHRHPHRATRSSSATRGWTNSSSWASAAAACRSRTGSRRRSRRFEGRSPAEGSLDITLYRDDLSTVASHPVVGSHRDPGGHQRQGRGADRRRALYGPHGTRGDGRADRLRAPARRSSLAVVIDRGPSRAADPRRLRGQERAHVEEGGHRCETPRRSTAWTASSSRRWTEVTPIAARA